jgi:hypothetical protein
MSDTTKSDKMALANTVADALADTGMDLEDMANLAPCLPEHIREGRFKKAVKGAETMAKLAREAAEQYDRIAAAIRLEAFYASRTGADPKTHRQKRRDAGLPSGPPTITNSFCKHLG